MKILAHDKAGIIASLTENELCLLMGFSSLYDDKYKELLSKAEFRKYGERPCLRGLEVDVTNFHNKVYHIRHRENEAIKAAKVLRELAEALEIAWPSLKISEEQLS